MSWGKSKSNSEYEPLNPIVLNAFYEVSRHLGCGVDKLVVISGDQHDFTLGRDSLRFQGMTREGKGSCVNVSYNPFDREYLIY